MVGDFAIRPANAADYEAIRSVIAASARAMIAPAYGAAMTDAALTALVTMSDENLATADLRVAEIGGTIVGTAGLGAMDAHGWTPEAAAGITSQVRTFFVDPGFSRRCIGRRLYGHVEAVARAKGHAAIGVRSSLNAVPFYAAMGFRVIAHVDLDVGGDASVPIVLMAKRLPP